SLILYCLGGDHVTMDDVRRAVRRFNTHGCYDHSHTERGSLRYGIAKRERGSLGP
ncbi:hypothetical protein Tco_0913098, partial [Tanacetum coccineum]